jgi:two-component system NarL family sensor kinase
LVSVSFLRPKVSQTLLILAVFTTLLNLVFPKLVLHIPSVLLNRSLAALSILISTFFMLRYIQYQRRIQEQDQLLETERRLAQVREDLTATLTHDLKTPLLGAEKTLQYMLEGTFGPITGEQEDVLGALERSNHRQVELVDNLLSVYRHDNLGVELHLVQVDLDELVADIITEVQYLATERSITLDYSCYRTPPTIRGDAFQLKRVIANLLHNALNYTPAGGQIVVVLSEKSQSVLVEVSDSGPGLSEQDLENVFHRFYRAENSRNIVGTGLGLYLSRQIVLAHRGTLWAERGSSGGCKLSFTLPISKEGAGGV